MRSIKSLIGYNTFIRFNPLIRYNPFVSYAVFQLELSRKKMLLRILANAIEQDIPLVPLLIGFAEDHDGQWNEKILELAYLLKNNKPLPDALEQVGGLVPVGALPLIHAGMASGQPEAIFRLLADTMTEHSKGKQNVQSFSFIGYFISFVFIMIFITGFLMVYIIPKYKKILEDFGVGLPEISVKLIKTSDFIGNYFYLFILFFIVFSFIMSSIIRYASVHITYLRKVPLINRFTQKLWIPDILRSLSLTTQQNESLLYTIKTLARHIPNKHVRNKLTNAEISIQNGNTVWNSLADVKIIRKQEKDIFEAAERAGNLPWALKSISSRRDNNSNTRLTNFLAFIEPLFTIIMGGIVGYIAIGMFMPLVHMIKGMS
jgi:type II secretory pathway component PulF